ncbi:MAG: type II secretion system F family protein, partial [bacterium]
VGEVGGILESSLIRLADIMEKKLEIRKKVTSACLYPAVSMSVALGVVFLVMWKAVPRFVEIYERLKADLPTATKQLIAVSNFITAWPKVYVPVLILLIAGLILYKKTPTGRRLFDFVAMKSPILGTVNTKINVARVTRTLGNLLSAGIPLLESLSVAAMSAENVCVAENLDEVYDQVEKGGKMEEPLRAGNVFPPLVVDMITIGDEAGALDTMLMKIAETYDTEVDTTLKGLTAIIEPLLLVGMGFIVMFIALALFLPYFNMVKIID